ncbi:hypothetical protein B0J17DRAFT_148897 [Rhizoctonia solani]|nr:hypothetical protein B0J17DRAFT_148897 [Rhizoctonia solani]
MPLLSSNPTKLSLGGSFVNSGSLINAGSLINSGSLGIGSLNKISASSFNGRTQDPHKIDFSEGWGKGPTEKWYAQQQGHTTFRKLQYRKEREAPFNHEFIVVELDNNTVCRFDRRGDVNNRANVLMGEPIPSEDTAHIIAKSDDEFYPIIDADSDLLLSIQFPQGQDLRTILAVCFGIHSNKATQSYSLTRYNCYFFSWMIITATARFTVDWTQLASEENLWQALIASAVKSFGRDQGDSGPLAQPKATVATASGPKNQVTQFIGSAYLCTTLQIALGDTREKIRTSLAELILHSTVDRAMEDVSKTSAQKAASKAARSHAAQAARDAAMEAVIETMWRDIISYEGTDGTDGGDIWAKACELAEKCVEKASSAAADSAGATNRTIVTPPATPSSESTPLPPTSTEGTESSTSSQVGNRLEHGMGGVLVRKRPATVWYRRK